MPDFQQGKIYKITHGDETYYGSTALTLRERMWAHKSKYKGWKKGVGSNCRSYTLFDKYGFENCPIELVEDYPCETKKELIIREDWYIKNMACINEISAYTSKEEIIKKKRQRYLDHKEEISEQRRQHYQANKEDCNEKCRQYNQANKEAISEKKKERIVCECGRTVRKSDIAQHRKSAIHLAKLNLTL